MTPEELMAVEELKTKIGAILGECVYEYNLDSLDFDMGDDCLNGIMEAVKTWHAANAARTTTGR